MLQERLRHGANLGKTTKAKSLLECEKVGKAFALVKGCYEGK